MVSTVPGVALVPRATPVWLMAGIPPGCEGRANASAFAELRASGGHACAGRGLEERILHTARLLRHLSGTSPARLGARGRGVTVWGWDTPRPASAPRSPAPRRCVRPGWCG